MWSVGILEQCLTSGEGPVEEARVHCLQTGKVHGLLGAAVLTEFRVVSLPSADPASVDAALGQGECALFPSVSFRVSGQFPR